MGLPNSGRATGILWALALGAHLPDGNLGLRCFEAATPELVAQAGELLGRHLRGRVRGGVGRDHERLRTMGHHVASPRGEEDLEGDEDAELAGRRGHDLVTGAHHRIAWHAREVGEPTHERSSGDVLAEGDSVDLLDRPDDVAVAVEGDDEVVEALLADRGGHPGEQRGAERSCGGAERGELPGADERPIESDHILGQDSQLRAGGNP